jgi:hypothetical protein
MQQADLLDAEQQPAKDAGANVGTRLRLRIKGGSPVPRECVSTKGSYAACLRALGSSIPTVEMLQLPPVVLETSKRPRACTRHGQRAQARPQHWLPFSITSITPAVNTSSLSRTPSNHLPERQKPGAPTSAE